jgi:hypothetical protein
VVDPAAFGNLLSPISMAVDAPGATSVYRTREQIRPELAELGRQIQCVQQREGRRDQSGRSDVSAAPV